MGNGLMAIVAGLLANTLVETVALGPVAPFDAAAVVMVLGGLVVAFTWTENYGDKSEHTSVSQQFVNAAKKIVSGAVDVKVESCGLSGISAGLGWAGRGDAVMKLFSGVFVIEVVCDILRKLHVHTVRRR